MKHNPGDTRKINLHCPLVNKEIGMIQRYCEIFDTQSCESTQFEWVNDICLNRYECEKKGVLCKFCTRDIPGARNPFTPHSSY